ncbi:MAG TPA: hypothetical protein VE995_04025, partial [Gaiellaceae bacterium]|nr:hypothetical protein [Gaiellaceae bacterium]
MRGGEGGTSAVVGGASVDASGPAGAALLPRGLFERRRARRRSSRARTAVLRRTLAGADLVALVAAYAGASALVPELRGRASLIAFAVALPLWSLVARAAGLYDRDDRRPGHSTIDELVPLSQLLTVGTWCGLLVRWALSGTSPTGGAAIFWAFSLGLVPALRAAARTTLRRRRSPQRTLIVGAGDVGQLVARKLVQHPEWGLRLVGFVDAYPRPIRPELAGLPVLGRPQELDTVVAAYDVERVIVAFSHDGHASLTATVHAARDAGVHVDVVPRLFDAIGPRGHVTHVEGFPLVSLSHGERSELARAAKRALDVVLATALLLLSLPLFAWIAWRIK